MQTPSDNRTNKSARTGGCLLSVFIALWIVTLLAWGYDHLSFRLTHDAFYRKQRTLIYDIDHDVIRQECRQLLADNRERRPTTQPASPSAKTKTPGIDLLQPHGPILVDGEVILSFGGGFHGSWLHFYEDASQGRGTKNLGGGLWFEDEFNQIPDP